MTDFNLVSVFRLIIRWIKPIAIVCIAAVLGAAIITDPRIMPPEFESVTIFYPANPALTDRQNLFRTEAGDLPVDVFGEERDVDRLLAIAKSSQLANYLIQKFDLFKHYDIDNDSDHPNYDVNQEFESRYKAMKNELGAIEIHVIDRNPQLAANMANEAVRKMDEIYNGMTLNSRKEALNLIEEKFSQKQEEVAQLTDSLTSMRKRYGIINIERQSAQLANSSEAASFIDGMEKVQLLEKRKESAVEDLNKLTTLVDQYRSAADKQSSAVYILEKAYPAEKKSKPIRWLIVVGSFLAAFFISVVAAIIIEQMRITQVHKKVVPEKEEMLI